jgi:hypothetical protein
MEDQDYPYPRQTEEQQHPIAAPSGHASQLSPLWRRCLRTLRFRRDLYLASGLREDHAVEPVAENAEWLRRSGDAFTKLSIEVVYVVSDILVSVTIAEM